jgi:hypothetical protein
MNYHHTPCVEVTARPARSVGLSVARCVQLAMADTPAGDDSMCDQKDLRYVRNREVPGFSNDPYPLKRV